MGARGSQIKEEITNKILALFGDDAAVYDKTIRVRGVENGETIEVKITLTAAKDCIMTSNSAAKVQGEENDFNEIAVPDINDTSSAPTKEEQEKLSEYIASLERFNMI